jgi:hypothetical protein
LPRHGTRLGMALTLSPWASSAYSAGTPLGCLARRRLILGHDERHGFTDMADALSGKRGRCGSRDALPPGTGVAMVRLPTPA